MTFGPVSTIRVEVKPDARRHIPHWLIEGLQQMAIILARLLARIGRH